MDRLPSGLSLPIVLLLPAVAVGQTDEDDFAKNLRRDLQSESVVSIAESGDLIFFGGAFTIPATRPSLEECGVWLTVPARSRPKRLAKKRRDATTLATNKRYSPRERHEFVRKSVAPLKRCEARFKKRCEEVRKQVPLEVRQAAIVDTKKAIENLANAGRKKAVTGHLRMILRQCPLDE